MRRATVPPTAALISAALIPRPLEGDRVGARRNEIVVSARANLAYAYALSDKRNEAIKILNDLKTGSARNASEIALMYVGLGEKDQAMAWLEKAYDEHFNPSILMRPAFDPLRSDPRFQDLVHRVGLPG